MSDLYAGLTELVLTKNPEHLSIHRGLWGPDTKTNAEGLDRANRILVRGCRLGPGRHVLDAGCGVGGTAIFLAETHGVRVGVPKDCTLVHDRQPVHDRLVGLGPLRVVRAFPHRTSRLEEIRRRTCPTTPFPTISMN